MNHQQAASSPATPTHVQPGGTFSVEVRFSPQRMAEPFADFDAVFAAADREADAFYAASIRPELGADQQLVGRQAFAGLLWSKQYYHYDV